MCNYKYLVLTDLDGTLLNSSKQLSNDVIAYVHKLNNRNDILFSFSTGRTWQDSKDIYEKLKLKGFVSCCNSSLIINPHSNQVIHYFLSKKVCYEMLKNPLFESHLVKGWIITDKLLINLLPDKLIQALNIFSDNNCDAYCIKLFFKNEQKIIDQVISFIKSFNPKLRLTIFYDGDFVNFEIQAGKINKEHAVEFFSHYYGISPENILTFGDNVNDVQVLEGSSRSYAVANAAHCIKQHAKFISQFSNDENAVIKELENFLNKNNI